MTNEIHNSYKYFLLHRFFPALHVSKELLVHHQEHCLIYSYNFIAARLARTIVPNCVIQYIRQYSWWWTSNSYETCRARKNSGIKNYLYVLCILLVIYTFRSVVFGSQQTVGMASGIWCKPFSHPMRSLTHVTQQIWGTHLLSWSPTLHPKQSP